MKSPTIDRVGFAALTATVAFLQQLPEARSESLVPEKETLAAAGAPGHLAQGQERDRVAEALRVSNVNVRAGRFEQQDREFIVEAGPFYRGGLNERRFYKSLKPFNVICFSSSAEGVR